MAFYRGHDADDEQQQQQQNNRDKMHDNNYHHPWTRYTKHHKIQMPSILERIAVLQFCFCCVCPCCALCKCTKVQERKWNDDWFTLHIHTAGRNHNIAAISFPTHAQYTFYIAFCEFQNCRLSACTSPNNENNAQCSFVKCVYLRN